jgi:uncharacterized membrane protein YhaH (DUF805 family)
MYRSLLGVLGIVFLVLIFLAMGIASTENEGAATEISDSVSYVFLYFIVTLISKNAMVRGRRDQVLSGMSLAMFFVMVLGITSNNMSGAPSTDTAPLHALEVVAAVLLFTQPVIDLVDLLMLRFNRKW